MQLVFCSKLFSANIFNSIERVKSALSQIKELMHINVLLICIHFVRRVFMRVSGLANNLNWATDTFWHYNAKLIIQQRKRFGHHYKFNLTNQTVVIWLCWFLHINCVFIDWTHTHPAGCVRKKVQSLLIWNVASSKKMLC